MKEVPWRDVKVFLGNEQLAQFAVFVVLTADERDQSPVLAFAEKVAEKFGGFFSAPVFKATQFRYADALEVYRLAEVERRERLVGNLPPAGFVRDAESKAMEIPDKILWFVDVETQNVVLGKLAQNNVGCFALAACEDEDHDGGLC